MVDVSVVIPVGPDTPPVQYDRAARSACDADCAEVAIVFDGGHIELNTTTLLPYCEMNREQTIKIFSIHAGVCHARNLGVFRAKHNLIVPLDADDELMPDGLQALVDAWQPGTLVYGGWIEGDKYKSPAPPEMLNRKNVAHATWLFHKDDWRRVGGYDPDFNIGGEDYAFMVALVAAGVKAVRIDTPIYRRAVREGSRTGQARSRFPFIQQLLREKYPAVMN